MSVDVYRSCWHELNSFDSTGLDIFNSFDSESSYNYEYIYPRYELNEFNDEWREKSVCSWTRWDIMSWLKAISTELDTDFFNLSIEQFGMLDGYQLRALSVYEFERHNEVYGKFLYDRLQEILVYEESVKKNYICDITEKKTPVYHDLNSTPEVKSELTYQPPYEEKLEVSHKSEDEEISQPIPQIKEKKRPGRPRGSKRRTKTEKLGRLWEFLRDLLKNREYCPSLIAWENYEEGMFRFVHSDKVAKLWGTKKGNPDMNYEKLSRAMRYYYKSKVLRPVYGRRLVYKFGENATGWRVENPNFVNK